MIKFFRNIRLHLLTPGDSDSARRNTFWPSKASLPRYLVYAIGEIVLVVIGILIALQINNWNEYRKDRFIESQILTELRKSLNSDIENQLNPNIVTITQDLANVNTIIRNLEHKWPYQDSLNTKFRSLMFSKSFEWEITAYKNLENEGLDIISDPELKDAILRLYNMNYPELQDYIGNFSNNLMEFFRPEMRNKFEFNYQDTDHVYYIPRDYENLKTDIIFMNTVLTSRINFQNIYGALQRTKSRVEQVIQQIDEEIIDKPEN